MEEENRIKKKKKKKKKREEKGSRVDLPYEAIDTTTCARVNDSFRSYTRLSVDHVRRIKSSFGALDIS